MTKGREGLLACGSCHLMSGIGHPESANLTGYTADYLVQQMHDFRNGTRPDFARRMDTFAKAMTDDEIRQAAEWFAALPPQAVAEGGSGSRHTRRRCQENSGADDG